VVEVVHGDGGGNVAFLDRGNVNLEISLAVREPEKSSLKCGEVVRDPFDAPKDQVPLAFLARLFGPMGLHLLDIERVEVEPSLAVGLVLPTGISKHRAQIRLRSNSAKPPRTVTISLPCGVVVSARATAAATAGFFIVRRFICCWGASMTTRTCRNVSSAGAS